MNIALKVKNLTKEYPHFLLDDVSFEFKSGCVMGLIGRNGAGKTTTIKALLNLIQIKSGDIEYFGLDLKGNEAEIKKVIGYSNGTIEYYKKKKIKNIISITKTFYDNWSETEYRKYIELFELDEEKTPSQLSEGMKVKLNLAIALSHNAKILILDEPTSGLDPVSRDELLDIFKYLAKQGVAILFSSHITSDLEKCADYITYIKKGKIQYTGELKEYIEYCSNKNIGCSLEEIMIYFEKGLFYEKSVK